MSLIFNVYCDESCHLENDGQTIMVLGAVWCLIEKSREIFVDLRNIKKKHNLLYNYELKWSKVSPSKQDYYMEVLDYFLDNDDLHFRALVVPEKAKLRHDIYKQTHDIFYYKMFFNLLKVIFEPKSCYRIYFDIKDTNSAERLTKLQEVLRTNIYDFNAEVIKDIQTVRSHEVELIQLTDFLTGIISYVNRGLSTSVAKINLADRLKNRSGYSLTKTTLLREDKVNLFFWVPPEEL